VYVSSDLQHHLFQMTFDGNLFLSQFEEGRVQRVLDVGTGTGVWAIDYGICSLAQHFFG
jgi:hypothetical protein